MINCPPPDTIRQVLEGTLSDEAMMTINEHFDECESCRKTLERLSCIPEIEHLLVLGEFCTTDNPQDPTAQPIRREKSPE